MPKRSSRRETSADQEAKKKKQCCSRKKQSNSTGSPRKTPGRYIKFLKVYKGSNDYHIPLFEEVKRVAGAENVLYPGSYFHLSASLVFGNVQYVDCDEKMAPFFEDCFILKWLECNKTYEHSMNLKFLCENFENKLDLEDESFDLVISLSAGLVSKSCSKYLKVGGMLLAGDAHYDARFAYVNSDFSLVGVYDWDKKCLDLSKEAMEGHFITTTGKKISKKQVQESVDVPKLKRSFKLQKEALFYLFKKLM